MSSPAMPTASRPLRAKGAEAGLPSLLLTWTIASALGAGLAAALAGRVLPGASLIRSAGQAPGWQVVALVAAIGAGLGLGQWLALLALARPRAGRRLFVSLLWIPATGLGVAVMLLAMWNYAAEALMIAPQLLAGVMLPGLALLAFGQQLVLHAVAPAATSWAVWPLTRSWLSMTIVGGAVGSIASFVAAVFFGALLGGHNADPFSVAALCAFIGGCQALPLSALTEAPKTRAP